MKKFLLLPLLLLLSGCASTPQPTVEPSDKSTEQIKVDRVRNFLHESVPYVKAASAAAIRVSLQYAETDATRRDELRAKIFVVSSNLDNLLSANTFDPGAVTDALVIKEDYVDGILQAISTIYTAAYASLEKDESATLAIELLQALADGVKMGTQP